MFLGGICVKRKKRWLRWIAWTLLLVLCMNSAGTTVLAVSVEEENIPNINSTQEGEMRTEDFIPEESTSLSEETSKEENTSPSEETPGEEITPPLEEIPKEEITPSQGELSEEEKPSRSRLHKRNHRNFRRFPKDLILISMSLLMETR